MMSSPFMISKLLEDAYLHIRTAVRMFLKLKLNKKLQNKTNLLECNRDIGVNWIKNNGLFIMVGGGRYLNTPYRSISW